MKRFRLLNKCNKATFPHLLQAQKADAQWLPGDHVVIPPRNQECRIKYLVETVNIYEDIYRGGHDVPLSVEGMKENSIEVHPYYTHRKQAVPSLVVYQVMFSVFPTMTVTLIIKTTVKKSDKSYPTFPVTLLVSDKPTVREETHIQNQTTLLGSILGMTITNPDS